MLAWGCPSPSQEAPLLDPRSVVTAIRKSAFPNQGWGRGFLGARPLLLLHCSVGGARFCLNQNRFRPPARFWGNRILEMKSGHRPLWEELHFRVGLVLSADSLVPREMPLVSKGDSSPMCIAPERRNGRNHTAAIGT